MSEKNYSNLLGKSQFVMECFAYLNDKQNNANVI